MSVGEQQELRVAVEGDVGKDFALEGLYVLCEGFYFDFGESLASGKGF